MTFRWIFVLNLVTVYIMVWLLYTLTGVSFLAVFYILSRVFLKDKNSDPVAYAIVFNLICAILVFAVALKNGFVLPDLHKYALNLIFMTILYTGSQVFVFKASKAIEASEFIIFSSTRAIWTIAVALLFLGESFNLPKTLGTILILFAVIFVSFKKKRIRLQKGHLFALAAAFCIGVGLANDAFILGHSDALSYGALAFILPGILTLFVFPSSTKKLKTYLNLKLLSKILLLSVFYCIGFISIYIAYQKGGAASQIAPIGQSVVVLTVLLAALFLKERDNLLKKIIAAIIVSIGVLLLK